MNRCESLREWMHERLDGPIPAERAEELERHLRACAGCREIDDGWRRVQAELRALPEVPLPDALLAAVWARTTQKPARPEVPARAARAWWFAAAAAVLTIALLLWLARPDRSLPSAAEYARAERDARLALGVAARAMHVTERTAVNRVLAKEVSPVLRRIPVRWPVSTEPDPRRS